MGCASSSSIPDTAEPADLKRPSHDNTKETPPVNIDAPPSVPCLHSRSDTTSRESVFSLSPFNSKASLYSTQNDSDTQMSDLHGEHIVTGLVLDGVLEESTVGDEKNSPISSEGYRCGSLTLPNLQANDSVSLRQKSSTSLQDILDIANSRSTYKAGAGEPSVTSSEGRDNYVVFHSNQRKFDLQKNHSQKSTLSREDSCVSSIYMSDFGDKHHQMRQGELQKNHSQKSNFSREDSGLSSINMTSENSEKSKVSAESPQSSAVTGMSNMSPIVLRSHEDLQLEATRELHEGEGCSCSETSSVQEDQICDAQLVSPHKQEEVDEWKAYLRRMSKDRQGEEEGSGSDSDEESDDSYDDDLANTTISSSLQADEEVPGYFLYVTEEGHEIWILLDQEGRSRADYTDEVVHSMLQSGGEEEKEDSYSAFHLSKDAAMTNVTQVREFLNKQKYEKALVVQQEEQQKKLMLLRQQHSTATATTDEDGNSVEGMTIAERKKLLWNSSGKLEATNRV